MIQIVTIKFLTAYNGYDVNDSITTQYDDRVQVMIDNGIAEVVDSPEHVMKNYVDKGIAEIAIDT